MSRFESTGPSSDAGQASLQRFAQGTLTVVQSTAVLAVVAPVYLAAAAISGLAFLRTRGFDSPRDRRDSAA